jgi:hypothetical protein
MKPHPFATLNHLQRPLRFPNLVSGTATAGPWAPARHTISNINFCKSAEVVTDNVQLILYDAVNRNKVSIH